MSIHPQDWIPHRPPFLFVDEVLSLEERSIVARKTFEAAMEIYRGHYPEHPVTPGALLCEAMFQTAGILVSYDNHKKNPSSVPSQGMPVLSRIEEARFHTPVFPDETVEMRITWEETMGHFFCFRGLMSCRGKRVLSLRFILAHVALEEDSSSAEEVDR
ncbi:MAG: beta-hydroxyacyl-ACP dehydratase [Puniceicoccales bacterium]|jgi:3-hydroxyacyl-[acyl-carrier-protein] dehydratase|nr:beta-hydroxyacyl-ACP dehydratase [Puniceicoccales bacterium]